MENKRLYKAKIVNKNFILGFLSALVICISIFLIFKDRPISQFVYVDMDRVTKAVSQKILSQNLNNRDVETQIEHLRERFNDLIEQYSKKHNKLLYSHPRPLKGAKDATEELLEGLFKTFPLNQASNSKVLDQNSQDKVESNLKKEGNGK